MSSFKHMDAMIALLSEIYELNERIMTGDIVSNRAAIKSPRMAKMLAHYRESLTRDGATAIFLDAYPAAGGWVGLTYSYTLDGVEIAGSQTPRRV